MVCGFVIAFHLIAQIFKFLADMLLNDLGYQSGGSELVTTSIEQLLAVMTH